MLIIFYLLLVLRMGRSTSDHIFETKTVDVGEHVKMLCDRKSVGTLFWIRFVPGNVPEILGNTKSSEGAERRIAAVQDPGTFTLHIKKTKRSDTAVYCCMRISHENMTFLNGTYLTVKGPEPEVTTVPPSDPVSPGDSVTLQCPEEHNVCCFRVGPHQSQPGFIKIEVNSNKENESNPEGTKKFEHRFFKNVSSSDAGTCYCAVASCGEIFFGNRWKPDTEAVKMWDSSNAVLLSLCSALALSLVVVAFLLHSIKKLHKKYSCGYSDAAVALQIHSATGSDHQPSQQTDEDSLIYAAPTIISRKVSEAAARNTKTEEEESVYTTVK